MSDSRIEVGQGGASFVGDDATALFAAATLRSALGLLKAGIKPRRGYTLKHGLAAASRYTGKRYKRTEIDKARDDLQLWINTMRAALPIVRK